MSEPVVHLAPPDNTCHSSSDTVKERIAFFDQLAAKHGWSKVKITTDNSRAQRQRYQRARDNGDSDVLDCWPTTLVVGSFLRHPRQGKTQLFRKECSLSELEQIFINPRSHTGKGYQQQSDNQGTSSNKRGRDMAIEANEEEGDQGGRRVRRRLACSMGPQCRDWDCRYSHPPRCFYKAWCWFEPNCWFDHTHNLCRHGRQCAREDCWFSHRNPDLFY